MHYVDVCCIKFDSKTQTWTFQVIQRVAVVVSFSDLPSCGRGRGSGEGEEQEGGGSFQRERGQGAQTLGVCQHGLASVLPVWLSFSRTAKEAGRGQTGTIKFVVMYGRTGLTTGTWRRLAPPPLLLLLSSCLHPPPPPPATHPHPGPSLKASSSVFWSREALRQREPQKGERAERRERERERERVERREREREGREGRE